MNLTFQKLSLTILVIIFYLMLCFPVMAGGFTVKSIDMVGDTFLVNVIANGGGNSLKGVISPSDFNIPGIQVNSTIIFEISNVAETLTYAPINMGTGALWHYKLTYYEAGDDFWTGAYCAPIPAYCFITIPGRLNGFGNQQTVVIEKVPAGSYGVFQNPDRSSNAIAKVTVGGKIFKENIGSGESAKTHVQFKNVPISIMFAGAVLTGKAVPTQYPYVATHPIGASQWRVADRPAYDNIVNSMIQIDTKLDIWKEQEKKYKSWAEKTTREELVCPDKFCSPIQRMTEAHNIQIKELLNKNVQIDYGAITVKSNIAGYNGNIYHVLDRTIANNEYIINIKASALDIMVLSGKPQINNIITSSFASGDGNAFIRVIFTNEGNNTGTFAAVTNGSFESNKITLAPREQGNLVLFLKDGMNASDILKENVEVYDIASGASDSREFTVNTTQPKTYIPNSTRVYNDVVIKADISGMQETKEAECSTGLWQFIDGKYQCQDIKTAVMIPQVVETIKPPQPFIIDPPAKPPEPTFDYMWIAIILLIIILIVLLIKYILSFNILSMARSRQKKGSAPATFVMLGLLVLLILGLSLYALYWESVLDLGNKMMNDMMIEIVKSKVKL